MRSTPPVFHAPAVSAVSTPMTPAVFCNDSYPWVSKTPEASPFCWGIAPRSENEVCMEAPISYMEPGQPMVSRAFLKAVCEPFFEEMLTAVHEAVEQHLRNEVLPEDEVQNMDQRGNSCHGSYQKACQLDPLPDVK